MPSRTFGIIKPDSIAGKRVGQIISAIEARPQLKITAMQMVQLTQDQAKEFWSNCKDRPTFERMTAWMASGPSIIMRIESEKRDNAWELWRMVLRDIRAKFRTGTGDQNSAHGSDSAESAERELAFFGLA